MQAADSTMSVAVVRGLVAQTLESIPTVSNVRMQPASTMLQASCDSPVGQVLLSVPLNACISSAAAPPSSERPLQRPPLPRVAPKLLPVTSRPLLIVLRGEAFRVGGQFSRYTDSSADDQVAALRTMRDVCVVRAREAGWKPSLVVDAVTCRGEHTVRAALDEAGLSDLVCGVRVSKAPRRTQSESVAETLRWCITMDPLKSEPTDTSGVQNGALLLLRLDLHLKPGFVLPPSASTPRILVPFRISPTLVCDTIVLLPSRAHVRSFIDGLANGVGRGATPSRCREHTRNQGDVPCQTTDKAVDRAHLDEGRSLVGHSEEPSMARTHELHHMHELHKWAGEVDYFLDAVQYWDSDSEKQWNPWYRLAGRSEALESPDCEEVGRTAVGDAAVNDLLRTLLRVYDEHSTGGEDDPCAAYMLDTHPMDHVTSLAMACWEEGSPAACRAQHSVAWRRARSWRAMIEVERVELLEAGVRAARCRERYRWLRLVTERFARRVDSSCAVLCPLLDLVAHAALPNTALSLEGADVVLRAKRPLSAGDAVSLRYDASADFSDMFERYGVFDDTNVCCTAELIIPPTFLEHSTNLQRTFLEPSLATFVESQRADGCDASFDAWWVPAERPEACPLLAVMRASAVQRTLTTVENLPCDLTRNLACDLTRDLTQPLADPREEGAARTKLVGLIHTWLAGYSTTAEDDAEALLNGAVSADEATSARFVLHEKLLLAGAAATLQRSYYSL